MSKQNKHKLAQIQSKELRTICERISFYSEFHVDSELHLEQEMVVDKFNTAFAQTGKRVSISQRLACCKGICDFFEERLDNEMLQSEQYTLKVIQISLCLFSLLICPFISGSYGERGICIALSGIALFLVIGILMAKLLTLNRWLTSRHWFFMEAAVYIAFCILFCFCSIAMALLNVHRQIVLGGDDRQYTILAYIESLVLALCAGIFAIDVGCVYSQRLSRTWIPSVSKYRI